jgi:hypothetical protein
MLRRTSGPKRDEGKQEAGENCITWSSTVYKLHHAIGPSKHAT